jgi:glycosyltransferase involved in cell wall biosynthesis
LIRVSTIIPAYNSAATLRAAIDSALEQNYEGQEVIVVDDGSTDSTPSILNHYERRITVVTQENRGLSAARRAGVGAANGEYIALLDADDVWLPEKLSKSIKALDKNPKATLAFSDCFLVEDSKSEPELLCVGHSPSMRDLLTQGCPILPSTVVLPRSIFDLCGVFTLEVRGLGHEDLYMWLRARELGPFVYVNEPLILYRNATLGHRTVKYEPGRKPFERLVRARYGHRANGLLRVIRRNAALGFLQNSMQQFDSGNLRGALASVAKSLKVEPLYLFRAEIAKLWLTPRTIPRVIRGFLAAGSPRRALRKVV